VFDLMKDDPRWTTLAIPGYEGVTLSQIYAAAGSPVCDPTKPWHHVTNRTWTIWFATVCATAADATMDEIAFQTIAANWPECKYGNFSTSVNYDGGGSPPRLDFHPNALWYKWSVRGSGTTQSPVFYWADLDDMAIHLDFMLDSSSAIMTPWVLTVGHFDPEQGGTVTLPMVRDWIELLRSRGVTEFLVFGNGFSQTEENWNAFLTAIGHP
jgi:hypothetical protein